jgi:hypothetical protein
MNLPEEISSRDSCTVDWHPCDWLQIMDNDDSGPDMVTVLSPCHPQTFHIPIDTAVLSWEPVVPQSTMTRKRTKSLSFNPSPIVPQITITRKRTKSLSFNPSPIVPQITITEMLTTQPGLDEQGIEKVKTRTKPEVLVAIPIKAARKHIRAADRGLSDYKFMDLSKVEHMIWFYNQVTPSPSLTEKKSLSALLGLHQMQIHNWFKDCRRRGLPRRFTMVGKENE